MRIEARHNTQAQSCWVYKQGRMGFELNQMHDGGDRNGLTVCLNHWTWQSTEEDFIPFPLIRRNDQADECLLQHQCHCYMSPNFWYLIISCTWYVNTHSEHKIIKKKCVCVYIYIKLL